MTKILIINSIIDSSAYTNLTKIKMEPNKFSFCENLSYRVMISFDTNQMPLDFDKWIELDIKKIIHSKDDINKTITLNSEIYLLLNNYFYVVIELYDEDFTILLSGIEHTHRIGKGRKHIPIFALCNRMYIKITNNLKIYVESNNFMNQKLYPESKFNFADYDILGHKNNLAYLKANNELFNLLRNFPILYNNFKFTDTNTNSNDSFKALSIQYGFFTFIQGEINNIDDNVFYHLIENYKNNEEPKKILSEIQLFEKYYQHGFIKFISAIIK